MCQNYVSIIYVQTIKTTAKWSISYQGFNYYWERTPDNSSSKVYQSRGFNVKKQIVKRNETRNNYLEAVNLKFTQIETKMLKRNMPITTNLNFVQFSTVFSSNLQSYVGPTLQEFTSSALWYNTVALPIPNAGFLFQNAQFRTN